MAFHDLVDQVIALLQQRGRLSSRALKRQFELDDARLDDLRFELIEVQGVAADQDSAILVWTGKARTQPTPPEAPSATAPAALEAERRHHRGAAGPGAGRRRHPCDRAPRRSHILLRRLLRGNLSGFAAR